MTKCPLAPALAGRLRLARDELTERWLERISRRVSIPPERIFPSDDLLDHVPLLIEGVADHLEDPARTVVSEASIIVHARELGALRHSQGFDEFEILKEFEILGGILFSFLVRIVDEIDQPCTRGELLGCAHRLFQAIALIQEATTSQYLQLMRRVLGEREERLRAFNRALTHEFRNRIGAAIGAAQLLDVPELSESRRHELAGIVARNTAGMRLILDDLLELSRVNVDARRQRHVHLPRAAFEVTRQLRDAAAAARVELRLSADLPDVEVNAAAVELCLTNLISNSIKYADPAKEIRWVEVRGRASPSAESQPSETVVEVRDNGVGIPEEQRARVFERFFRARSAKALGVEGTGLGLSIVRETVDALGGRIWVEFPDEGSVFAFTIPCRRMDDVTRPAPVSGETESEVE